MIGYKMSMTFEINFDLSDDYVYVMTSGYATSEGFDSLLTEIVNSPKWQTGNRLLIDHRKLNLNKLTSADMNAIKDIVKKNSEKLGNGSCAFVMKDDLGFGLARMYELLGGGEIHLELAVFYNIDEAVDWLKIK